MRLASQKEKEPSVLYGSAGQRPRFTKVRLTWFCEEDEVSLWFSCCQNIKHVVIFEVPLFAKKAVHLSFSKQVNNVWERKKSADFCELLNRIVIVHIGKTCNNEQVREVFFTAFSTRLRSNKLAKITNNLLCICSKVLLNWIDRFLNSFLQVRDKVMATQCLWTNVIFKRFPPFNKLR